MQVVILAGGFGTRLSEETVIKPKPMVEIGGRPILLHIMSLYSHYGFNDFIICLGYKGYVIKEYFANYSLHMSDVTFDMASGSIEVHNNRSEPWKITLVDTGHSTMTGGRLKRVAKHLKRETFCFTYGDGLSDIDIAKEVAFHKKHKKAATVAAVSPSGRFGRMAIENNNVKSFQEKPRGESGFVNGGFFVLEPSVLEYIKDDTTVWEKEPLEDLARAGELMAYEHDGFWQPMDTLYDKNVLEGLWNSGKAPWVNK